MNAQSYERLEKVIEWAELSTHAFAMKIGMKRSENLYRIMRNKENVSIKLISLILERYPQISRNWLIYGEGNMIVEKDDFNEIGKIPLYYDISDRKIDDLLNITPNSYIYISIFESANLAVEMTDKAMEPLIPLGSIIVLKNNFRVQSSMVKRII